MGCNNTQYSVLYVEFILPSCTPVLIEEFLTLHKEDKANVGWYL